VQGSTGAAQAKDGRERSAASTINSALNAVHVRLPHAPPSKLNSRYVRIMNTMQAKIIHKVRAPAALAILALGLAGCASVPNQPGAYQPQTYYGGSAYYGYSYGGGYSPWGYGYGYGWGPGLGSGFYGPPVIIEGGQPVAGGPPPPSSPSGGIPPPPPGGGAPPPRPPPMFGSMHHGFMPRCLHGKNQSCP